MSTGLLIGVLIALVAAIAGYLTNQLPEIPQFKGRNWLVIRLFVWAISLTIALTLLVDETVTDGVKTYARYSLVACGTLLLVDGVTLMRQLAKQADEELAGPPQDLRRRLLQGVQEEIATRLEDSLQQQVVINMLMEQQLRQVNRPDKAKRISLEQVEQTQAETNLILLPEKSLRQLNQPDQPLDPQESILETFNRPDVGHKLLILGAPGAGKTTTLLKLAETLIAEALQPNSQLIPVIFELSTWQSDQQPIYDWLIDQLKLNYNIDAKTSKPWLKSGQLLPLLDGLDELGLRRQQLCIDKLNEFVTSTRYPHVVVCCRREEYDAGRVRLGTLRGAVCLEPLSDAQIQRYFCEQLGQSDVWAAMQQQKGLQALLQKDAEGNIGILRIPLFLTLLSAAYDSQKPINSKGDLFNAYISRRLAPQTRQTERAQFRRDWAYASVAQAPDEAQTQHYLQ
ncbi:MAG: NACHT domain-containing protein, partial [Cyanobacteria bacterium P01_D01_bin.71]